MFTRNELNFTVLFNSLRVSPLRWVVLTPDASYTSKRAICIFSLTRSGVDTTGQQGSTSDNN